MTAQGYSGGVSGQLERVRPGVWEVAPTAGMRVPARIFASDSLIDAIRDDQSVRQTCNVAHLPGIVGASLAMPDMHEGYGFPIGGVAAFSENDGVVSPGGVGYDINCGVRLMRTDVRAAELGDRLERLVRQIQRDIPAGVGSEGAIATLSADDLDERADARLGVGRRSAATARPRTWASPRRAAACRAPTRRR